ncbi:MAG: leucine-rich repeat protein [Ruminococcus sp.]
MKKQSKALKWVHTRSTRHIAFLLVVTMIMSVIGIATYSAETTSSTEKTVVTSGDYQYSLLDDGTAEIVKYTGSATALTIPSSLDGKKVTAIGGFAFDACKTITSLVIPEGVTSIGSNSFRYCENMKTVSLPQSLTTMGISCFSFCRSLESISLPDSVTSVANYAFNGCSALASVKLSNKLEVLSDFMFSECEKLTSIEFPSSVKEIGQNTFAHCYGFTEIDVPSNVTMINTSAFSYCKNLTKVTLHEGLETINAFAFTNCKKLMEVTVPDTVSEVVHMSFGYWWDDVTWNYLHTDGFVLKGYRGSATEAYAIEYDVPFVSLGDSILTPPTEPPSTTQPPSTAPPEPGTVYTLYYKNTSNFSSVYAYYWPDGGSGPVAWPGTAMTKVTDDVYSIQVPVENNMIIFSNKGSSQTGNLAIPGDNYIYDNGWKPYSDTPTETSTTQTEPTTSSTTQTEPTTSSTTMTTPTTSSSTEPTTSSQPSYAKGDVNGDGDVDVADATILQKYINKVAVSINTEVADVNGDGRVDVRDVTMIQKKVAGYNVF